LFFLNITSKVKYASITIPVIGHSNDSSLSTYTILLGSPLNPGQEYDLYIPFDAKVGNRLSGLYRSSYIDNSGQQK
jgi:hypothetical protein